MFFCKRKLAPASEGAEIFLGSGPVGFGGFFLGGEAAEIDALAFKVNLGAASFTALLRAKHTPFAPDEELLASLAFAAF